MRRRIRSAALPLHRHSLPQLAVDGALVALAYYLAFQLRFDSGPPAQYAHLREDTIWWVLAGSLPVLVLSRVYQRRWRYAGQRDYESVVRAVVVIVLLTVVAIEVLRPVYRYPHRIATVAVVLPNGVIVLFALLALVFLVGIRALARTVYERRPLAAFGGRKNERTVLIAGAGDGGRMVIREIMRNRELGLLPVGFLDDDPLKLRLRIDGVRVRGNTEGRSAAHPRRVRAGRSDHRDPLRAGLDARAHRARVPHAGDTGAHAADRVRAAADRTARSPGRCARFASRTCSGASRCTMELERVGAYLAGETVLVTGAGGSIGSELCRQIARVEPHRIVLLDHAEDNLFQIQRELEEERHVPPSMLAAVLADCKEEERMREVFDEHRPTIVFHAAAYKHVGLMEANPVEAVRNNAIGTRVVAHVAGEAAVRRFVLVSTDKAVAPATVMGASKALAEFALEAAAARWPGTRYNAVRFGNVLGSSGSVVPIFRRQIERGGPVTVTDERMTRYFMTIPEAVQLIIRSGSLASARAQMEDDLRPAGGRIVPRAPDTRGAEVFVLDMGEPVCIMDLARAMIELSGLDPDHDIDDRGRRAPSRREAARGAVQSLRAPPPDRRREDPAGRTRAAGHGGRRVDVRGDRPAGAGGRRGGPRREGVPAGRRAQERPVGGSRGAG